MHWNNEHMQHAYEHLEKEFESCGFSSDEIETLRTRQLSADEFKTSSKRVERMTVAAYYTGMLHAIHVCDNTVFSMIGPSDKEG